MTLLQAYAPPQAPPASDSASDAASDPASTRDRILGLVRDRAWTPRELGAALGVDRKTAEYHLHSLRRRGVVAERSVRGERRFALALGAPRAFAAAPPARTRARIAHAVEEHGLLTLEDLARRLGVSRNLAAYHVRRLAAEGIVCVRRLGPRVVVQAQGLAVQAEGPREAA